MAEDRETDPSAFGESAEEMLARLRREKALESSDRNRLPQAINDWLKWVAEVGDPESDCVKLSTAMYENAMDMAASQTATIVDEIDKREKAENKLAAIKKVIDAGVSKGSIGKYDVDGLEEQYRDEVQRLRLEIEGLGRSESCLKDSLSSARLQIQRLEESEKRSQKAWISRAHNLVEENKNLRDRYEFLQRERETWEVKTQERVDDVLEFNHQHTTRVRARYSGLLVEKEVLVDKLNGDWAMNTEEKEREIKTLTERIEAKDASLQDCEKERQILQQVVNSKIDDGTLKNELERRDKRIEHLEWQIKRSQEEYQIQAGVIDSLTKKVADCDNATKQVQELEIRVKLQQEEMRDFEMINGDNSIKIRKLQYDRDRDATALKDEIQILKTQIKDQKVDIDNGLDEVLKLKDERDKQARQDAGKIFDLVAKEKEDTGKIQALNKKIKELEDKSIKSRETVATLREENNIFGIAERKGATDELKETYIKLQHAREVEKKALEEPDQRVQQYEDMANTINSIDKRVAKDCDDLQEQIAALKEAEAASKAEMEKLASEKTELEYAGARCEDEKAELRKRLIELQQELSHFKGTQKDIGSSESKHRTLRKPTKSPEHQESESPIMSPMLPPGSVPPGSLTSQIPASTGSSTSQKPNPVSSGSSNPPKARAEPRHFVSSIEFALERCKIAIRRMGEQRALCGFIPGDTDDALEAVSDAWSGSQSLSPDKNDAAVIKELLYESARWLGIVHFYRNDLKGATAWFREAKNHISTQDETFIDEWLNVCRRQGPPMSPDGYRNEATRATMRRYETKKTRQKSNINCEKGSTSASSEKQPMRSPWHQHTAPWISERGSVARSEQELLVGLGLMNVSLEDTTEIVNRDPRFENEGKGKERVDDDSVTDDACLQQVEQASEEDATPTQESVARGAKKASISMEVREMQSERNIAESPEAKSFFQKWFRN